MIQNVLKQTLKLPPSQDFKTPREATEEIPETIERVTNLNLLSFLARSASYLEDFGVKDVDRLENWQKRQNKLITNHIPNAGMIDHFYHKEWTISLVQDLFAKLMEWGENFLSNETILPKIRFIGFDIGGGFAVLSALFADGIFAKRPVVVTFGQPRMGDENLAIYADSKITVYRVTHSDDVRTSFPSTKFGYRHLRTEYWIKKEASCECLSSKPRTLSFFPEVYRCTVGDTFLENQSCNAQYTTFKPVLKNENRPPSDIGPHNGPYFGYMMKKSKNRGG
ncbi:hypothetical protein G9A89_003414 [Geosiphon pyriformis]|nr:hypothetical protein G9A89_003414 [Geosiphon pyriformis]